MMVRAFALPSPQPGRRPRSSGRAVQMTSSGRPWPSRPGTRRTREARRLPSGDPRRSMTTGSPPASASKNRRQAAKSSSRSVRPLTAGQADERTELRLDPARLVLVLDQVVNLAPSFSLGHLDPSVSRIPGLRLDHLGERPEAQPFPYGQAACRVASRRGRGRPRRQTTARGRAGTSPCRAARRS